MRKSIFTTGIGLLLLSGAAFAWLNLAGGERTFEVSGRVVGFGDDATVYVEHGAVPGYLPARTTPFKTNALAQFDSLEMGDVARFQIVAGSDRPKIVSLELLPDNAIPRNPASAGEKQTDAADNTMLDVGEQVPDVKLVDQTGKTVRLSDYHGQMLVLTFIYTECPLPNFCPLMSKQFATLQPKLKARYGKKAQLLSISFDPKNDTPEVLTDYAKKYTDDLGTWTFATGTTPKELKKAKRAFGVTTVEKQGEIVHNLITALVDPDGRLVWTWRGNDWHPEDILRVARQTLDNQNQTASPGE